MILGGIIMIVGVIIQVTAVKGSRATAQFIIGRTITGVGNGIVRLSQYCPLSWSNFSRTRLPFQPTRRSAVAQPIEVSLFVSKVE